MLKIRRCLRPIISILLPHLLSSLHPHPYFLPALVVAPSGALCALAHPHPDGITSSKTFRVCDLHICSNTCVWVHQVCLGFGRVAPRYQHHLKNQTGVFLGSEQLWGREPDCRCNIHPSILTGFALPEQSEGTDSYQPPLNRKTIQCVLVRNTAGNGPNEDVNRGNKMVFLL